LIVDVIGERWRLEIVNEAAQRRPSSRIEKLSKKLLVTLTSLKEFAISTKLKIRCTERAHIKRGCVT
jgi:hypothetical protein